MRKWVGCLASAAVLLGCGTQGDPRPEELWDPCRIPAKSIRSTGSDPSTSSTEFLGGGIENSDICSWQGADRTLAVASTRSSFDEVEKNPRSYGFEPAAVGDRRAVSFLFTEDPSGDMCQVAIDTTQGVVIVVITKYVSSTDPSSSCSLAIQAANILDPVLPT